MSRPRSTKKPDVLRLWHAGERINDIANELRMCAGTVSRILQEEGLHTPKPTKHPGVNQNVLADDNRFPPSSWHSEIFLVGFNDVPEWALPLAESGRVKIEARP